MKVAVQVQLGTEVGIFMPPATELVDANGVRWTFNPSMALLRNGAFLFGWQVAAYVLGYLETGIAYVKGSSGQWYRLDLDRPIAVPPPVPVEPPPPPAPNQEPFWNVDIGFTEGIPAVVKLTDRAFDPDGDPLTFTLRSPFQPITGLSFDEITFELNYDGRPMGAPVTLDTSITIAAADGRP